MITWEMIKKLTENPEKEFVRKSDGLHIKTNEDGELVWDNGYQFMRLNHEWEEIKKPVDFMTAIQSEKPMSVEFSGTKIKKETYTEYQIEIAELKDENNYLKEKLRDEYNMGYSAGHNEGLMVGIKQLVEYNQNEPVRILLDKEDLELTHWIHDVNKELKTNLGGNENE